MSETNGTKAIGMTDVPPRARHVLSGFRIPGFGYLYFRKAWVWLRYSHRGKEYRRPTRTKDPKKAFQRLRELHGQAQSGGSVNPKVERVTVGELLAALEAHYRLNAVRGLVAARSHLKPIREAFGDCRAADLSAEAVDRYIEERLDAGKRPATVNRETQLLGQAFRLALQRKRVTAAPWIRRLSETGNRREGFLEPAEVEALVVVLPEDLRDFARFGYLSGWRKGEIASLGWADVDRDGRLIRLRPEESKNEYGRVLPLEGALGEIIERRWAAREYRTADGQVALSPFVFHRAGEPVGDFRKAWVSACTAAGLAGKLFHDLRRSAVRNMVRAGVPERVAMDLSGHKTRSIFDRYNITSEKDLREALQRTDAHVKGAPERTVIPLAQAQERQR